MDKCCGNCHYFKNESTSGNGWCEEQEWITNCEKICKCHEPNLNGWAEITQDNVDEVDYIPYNNVVIGWISNEEFHSCSLSYFGLTLKSIAQQGGFYYYVLPELKKRTK